MGHRGLLITVEGMDGSGKTTQIKMIEQYFLNRQAKVIFVREPGSTCIGEEIRNIILNTENKNMSCQAEMLLYAAARAQLVQELIKPSIAEGKVIVCDRFIDSTYVYQSFGRGLNLDIVKLVNDIALDGLEPDITLFLDLDPEISLKRREIANVTDRMEREHIEFHKKVYNGYKELSKIYPNRIKVINAYVSVEEIFAQIRSYLDDIIENCSAGLLSEA